MRIGIIGAGNIGQPLARHLTKLGHSVTIANSRGPETLTAIAADTGARAVTVQDAVTDADLVIVTIPQKAVPDLPKGLFDKVAKEVVVVDTGNYYPYRDGTIATLEGAETESEWVSQHLRRPVIKAFNNIISFSLAEGGLPKGAKDRIALPIAGDDAKAKAAVLALVDALGFDGVDAGSLAESWRQQPGTPVYCTDFDQAGVKASLAKADRARSPKVREESIARMMALPPGTPPKALVAMVRELAISS